MPMLNESSFCFGDVFHQRYQPKRHGFRYAMFMPMLDLDYVTSIDDLSYFVGRNKRRLYSFYDTDYLTDHVIDGETLKKRALRVCYEKLANPSVTDRLQLVDEQGQTKVLMLSQWRFLGKVFNPISVFYFFIADELAYIMAEVSNTPWKERYIYSYSKQEDGLDQWVDSKRFHVSPFNPMDMQYHWRNQIDPSSVSLTLLLTKEGNSIFNASYSYKRLPFDKKVLHKGLRAQPLLSIKAVAGIYWQALKLAIKRIPFYDHPKTKQVESSGE